MSDVLSDTYDRAIRSLYVRTTTPQRYAEADLSPIIQPLLMLERDPDTLCFQYPLIRNGFSRPRWQVAKGILAANIYDYRYVLSRTRFGGTALTIRTSWWPKPVERRLPRVLGEKLWQTAIAKAENHLADLALDTEEGQTRLDRKLDPDGRIAHEELMRAMHLVTLMTLFWQEQTSQAAAA